MNTLQISQIGLAQFMVMSGATLVKFNTEKDCFEFNSEKSGQEWRLSYARSPFSAFNAGVMGLQQIKKEASNVFKH